MADKPRPMRASKPPGPDETVPGGAYIRGGFLAEDGNHYGGQIVDAEGEVLEEFADDEVNPGVAYVKETEAREKEAKDKAARPAPAPAKPQNAPAPTPPAAPGQAK